MFPPLRAYNDSFAEVRISTPECVSGGLNRPVGFFSSMILFFLSAANLLGIYDVLRNKQHLSDVVTSDSQLCNLRHLMRNPALCGYADHVHKLSHTIFSQPHSL